MSGFIKKDYTTQYKSLPPIGWFLLLVFSFSVGLISQSLSSITLIVIGIITILSVGLFVIKPWYLTYLLILCFPFVSTLPRDLLPLPLKIDEMLILLGILVFFLSPTTSKSVRISRIDVAFIVLIIIGVSQSLASSYLRNIQTEWIELIALVKPYLLYRVILLTIDTKRKFINALFLLLLSPMVVSLLAFFQYLNIGNIQSLLAVIYYDTPAVEIYNRNMTGIGQILRATSTLGNWNALGSYSALAALLGFSLWQTKSYLYFKSMPLISSGASLFGLLLAGSSSSFVGFITGWFIIFYKRFTRYKLRKSHIINAVLIIFSLTLLLTIVGKDIIVDQYNRQSSLYIYDRASQQYIPTHGIPASIVVRWYLAKYLFHLMVNDRIALITGFGKNAFSVSLLPWGSPESGYMGMLFFYGPLYLIYYIVLLFTILQYSFKLRRKFFSQSPFPRALALSVSGMTIAMVVMNLVSSYYSAAGTSHFFIITTALMMSSMGHHIKSGFQNNQVSIVDDIDAT